MIEDGDNKGQSFATACFREAEEVSLLKRLLKCLALDLGWLLVAHFCQTCYYLFLKAKLPKIIVFRDMGLNRFLFVGLSCLGGRLLFRKEFFFLEVEGHYYRLISNNEIEYKGWLLYSLICQKETPTKTSPTASRWRNVARSSLGRKGPGARECTGSRRFLIL